MSRSFLIRDLAIRKEKVVLRILSYTNQSDLRKTLCTLKFIHFPLFLSTKYINYIIFIKYLIKFVTDIKIRRTMYHGIKKIINH